MSQGGRMACHGRGVGGWGESNFLKQSELGSGEERPRTASNSSVERRQGIRQDGSEVPGGPAGNVGQVSSLGVSHILHSDSSS